MNVPISRIVAALGGEQLINHRVRQEFDLMDVAIEGLPIASVAYLQNNFGFTNKEMSHILAISESTYQRRVRAKTRLTQDESEKAISLAEVYEKGMEVFQNKEDLDDWLTAKIPSLQNRRPITLLGSMLGRKQVMNVLNAILHGIYL
ncbi:antitoxin Xre-like helix-turn-helix domain-containing protein [Spirosoma montaniterrae]|uniref:Uncharacterized protein n=1 Tax=Spirosoma montaniterrae TaxID=1178516 RepID=A0A1P9WTE3_9BACT|nr:antitoxin Xre-like helix-turn-helix domain-containing protein [Spirosoma montaniterrae]AQG78603.1 hypothetical protein AWR27_04155 [Spirosoma montaniterrae]